MRIEHANPSDLPAVGTLLAAAGLPLGGVAAAFQTGVVARESDAIVGAAAVERYGEAGLLRSVVVAPGQRGTGLGRELVEAAEQLARSEGIATLYVLTETAIDWFPRLGYVPVSREEAAAAVGASIEFTMSCAVTGVAMRRDVA